MDILHQCFFKNTIWFITLL